MAVHTRITLLPTALASLARPLCSFAVLSSSDLAFPAFYSCLSYRDPRAAWDMSTTPHVTRICRLPLHPFRMGMSKSHTCFASAIPFVGVQHVISHCSINIRRFCLSRHSYVRPYANDVRSRWISLTAIFHPRK